MKLTKKGFKKEDIISFGNMFLIGNGHLGYRGTLEEYSKDELVGLNVVGLYDQYKNKWRESINMPNPLKVIVSNASILKNTYKYHEIELDIDKAIFKRKTIFDDVIITSERFISQSEDNLVLFKYRVKALKDVSLDISLGLDKDIYEINGPHFKKTKIKNNRHTVIFNGTTSENKKVKEVVSYIFNSNSYVFKDGMYYLNKKLLKNESFIIYCFARIIENNESFNYKFKKSDYNILKQKHIAIFKEKWNKSNVIIKGNKEANFAMHYSIYHLLILGNEKYYHSIPARGVSGETYKGAIFWDTEIFMVPFFTLTNPSIAKALLKYRINTLNGALEKAKEYGYEGAFYAWESQEFGQDACSKYNVTDPITGKPIRTYFNEKQIHISFDIVYALFNYSNVTSDYSILDESKELLIQVIKFMMSYSKLMDGKYHLMDVIGPDEYHERINDNAFTSYMAYYTSLMSYDYLLKNNYNPIFLNKVKLFLDSFYLPKENQNHIIEQFDGYFSLEDVSIDEVRSRLRHPNDYWGGKNGVATKTKIIKQADVIALLALFKDRFSYDTLVNNFKYYYPNTEHGSSLSSSMYSIIASHINKRDIAYKMFMKSATIDLGTEQKMFAGGIYIGGTHPASNGGAYLSLIFGICGLSFNDDTLTLNPHLPKEIKGVEFNVLFKGIKYHIIIDNKNHFQIEKRD